MNAALSIDLESYWHAELMRKQVDRQSADDRVLAATLPLLDFLADQGVKATFFIVGEIVAKHPHLVQRIAREGHEIGCHGYTHRPLWELTKMEFDHELRRFSQVLEQHLPGVKPRGFRAPTFSLAPESAWAIDVLVQHGYQYDSSIFPLRTPLYGLAGAPSIPYRPATDLVHSDPYAPIQEWPMTVWRFGSITIPVCGGFYLRALPMPLVLHGLRKAQERGPIVIYLHPWELDMATPRFSLSVRDRFITYYNIGTPMHRRLKTLIDHFELHTMWEVLSALG